jgi:hypothetical protein
LRTLFSKIQEPAKLSAGELRQVAHDASNRPAESTQKQARRGSYGSRDSEASVLLLSGLGVDGVRWDGHSGWQLETPWVIVPLMTLHLRRSGVPPCRRRRRRSPADSKCALDPGIRSSDGSRVP